MPAPDTVPQGTNYDFTYELEGDGVAAFTYTLEAKQYPGDSASISRTVTPNAAGVVPVTLTPAETTALDIGLWYLTITSTDTDETIHAQRRIQITKAWA